MKSALKMERLVPELLNPSPSFAVTFLCDSGQVIKPVGQGVSVLSPCQIRTSSFLLSSWVFVMTQLMTQVGITLEKKRNIFNTREIILEIMGYPNKMVIKLCHKIILGAAPSGFLWSCQQGGLPPVMQAAASSPRPARTPACLHLGPLPAFL